MGFKDYIKDHARVLDLRLYEYLFEEADPQPVISELTTFQNPDGGFGRALEPDLRLPDSSVLATTVAFQYLGSLGGANADAVVEPAIRYLLNTYDDSGQRWFNLPPAADKYPRAPWWNFSQAIESIHWGNPSAEVLGYLLRYKDKVRDQAFLDEVSLKILGHLEQVTEPEQHEVKCYLRLYRYAGKELRAKMHGHIAAHIKQLAKTRAEDWQGYVAMPLTFIDSPDSPFADLFDTQLLGDNVKFIQEQVVDNDHWEPTWKWGQFEQEWKQAKKEWSGKLTVENLVLLKSFKKFQ